LTQSLIYQLIERLNHEEVLYCHWKSNIDLAETIEGYLDVDLLVSSQSLARATEILMHLGFKLAFPRWGPNPPGVFHYYGYDSSKGHFVHLHMFTRVLTGESFLKSHLFPFEAMLTKNTYSVNGLKVASKEAELVLFVLRAYIKYGSLLDAIRLLKDQKKLIKEAQWLQAGSDMILALSLLEEYCPVVSGELFSECLDALVTQTPYLRLWKRSIIVRRKLRIYRKYTLTNMFLGYLQLVFGIIAKKLRSQKGGKVLSTGGTVISIVGADATGKSTLVSETSRWLRKNFVVTTIHAGKPPSTLITFPVNLLLVIYKRLLKRSSSASRDGDTLSSPDVDTVADDRKGNNSLVYAIRALVLAWDRRSLLIKARRAVANGEIIVCDRYPTSSVGMMDSPRLKESLGTKGVVQLIYNWFARMEKNQYKKIAPPDIVLRLNVSLEIARKRNAAREIVDDDIYLQNRHQQATEWFMPGTRFVQDVNTDSSLIETLSVVKQAIWTSL